MTEANEMNNGRAADWLLPSGFRVCLEMTSDWHVGSGAGRPGSQTRLVARDADELPYVPAKTLTGLWRDALERLAFGLDEGQKTVVGRAG